MSDRLWLESRGPILPSTYNCVKKLKLMIIFPFREETMEVWRLEMLGGEWPVLSLASQRAQLCKGENSEVYIFYLFYLAFSVAETRRCLYLICISIMINSYWPLELWIGHLTSSFKQVVIICFFCAKFDKTFKISTKGLSTLLPCEYYFNKSIKC